MDNVTEATTKKKPQPTVTEFKKWCRANKKLAMDVCKAMAFAEVERERVNAYIKPIFDSYTFLDTLLDEGERLTENRITDPKQLYLCTDETLIAHYYKTCETAHREHGFTGPGGYCPALTAEHAVTKAEWALLDAGCELFGLSDHPPMLDDRQKFIDLLIGACLKA